MGGLYYYGTPVGLLKVSWDACQQLGLPKLACTYSLSSRYACARCTHTCISECVCLCICEHTHPHTNAGATPEQTTKSFKKKAFERIIWQIPLHPNKNIPHSRKMRRLLFFPKNLQRRGLQPPINELDFLKSLIWESSSLLY